VIKYQARFLILLLMNVSPAYRHSLKLLLALIFFTGTRSLAQIDPPTAKTDTIAPIPAHV
jgi:hypothetical protein